MNVIICYDVSDKEYSKRTEGAYSRKWRLCWRQIIDIRGEKFLKIIFQIDVQCLFRVI